MLLRGTSTFSPINKACTHPNQPLTDLFPAVFYMLAWGGVSVSVGVGGVSREEMRRRKEIFLLSQELLLSLGRTVLG